MSQISVATLNLRNRQNRWLQRRELIVSELIDTRPDLVSLQEIYIPIGQGRWLRNQVNSRISGTSSHPYRLIQKRRQHPIRGYFEGVGILSKLPILSHDALNLGYGGRPAVRINVELDTRETLDFVAIHLHPVAEDREARLEQVMLLCGWLNGEDAVPLQVIAGDFNEIPTGPAIEYMKQLYRSAFVETQGYDPIATYPTALVSESVNWSGCLDYIFLSNQITDVLESRLIFRKPSTHDPTLYPSDHVGLYSVLEVEPTNWDAVQPVSIQEEQSDQFDESVKENDLS
jgi:endonuclease/exonuclease/phosphatase family metal-dependent hydrolase